MPGPISVDEVSPFKSIRKELEEGDTDVKEALKKMKEKVESWKFKDGEARSTSPERKKEAVGDGVGNESGIDTNTSDYGDNGFSLFSPWLCS